MNIYPKQYSTLDFTSRNKLPVGKIEVSGINLVIDNKIVRMVGYNLTDSACFPSNPSEIAQQLRRRGVNWVRLHHIDRILSEGWGSVSTLMNFVDALYTVGIRVSVDLYSKRHESSSWGNDGFKTAIYNANADARKDLASYASLLLNTPVNGRTLARHPGLFLVCLINEGAHLFMGQDDAVEKFKETFRWGKQLLLSFGYDGLISDCPDAVSDAGRFAPAAIEYDVALCHHYGDDARSTWNNAYWQTGWPVQGWQWGACLWYAQQVNKPMLLQEYGSLAFNPFRAVNGAFTAAELNRGGYSSCAFAWASNDWFLSGNAANVDFFCLATDLPRVVSDSFTAAMSHHDLRTNVSYFWGHAIGAQSDKYEYKSDYSIVKIEGQSGFAVLSINGKVSVSKKFLVFLFDRTESRGLDTEAVIDVPNDLNRKIVTPGSVQQAVYQGYSVTIPTNFGIKSAYQLNPWTGEKLCACKWDGKNVLTANSCGIVEVNLS